MGFRSSILAGTSLIRQAIKSPDYVPGLTGWSINRDGTVEFNIGVFRGVILASSFITATSGQRIEINSDDSNQIDFYDSDDNLIMSLGSVDGSIIIYDPSGTKDPIGISGGTITWYNRGGILTPDVYAYTIDGVTYLNTQLHGGVAFDSVNGDALTRVIPGSDTLETWQAPAYTANFAAGSSASIRYQALEYRKDAMDNIVVIGACHAVAALAAGAYTLFPISGSFMPKKLFAFTGLHVSSADVLKATLRVGIDSTGAVGISTTSAIAINDGFYISATAPLGNQK